MKLILKAASALSIFLLLDIGDVTAAEVTGKVLSVEGHVNPACRRVVLVEAGTGAFRVFRLPNPGATADTIAAALFTALATQGDMYIYYDPAQTTGCGSEPAIIYLRVDRAN